MPSSEKGKIGYCIQLKQIRAGHPEKVPHHQIRIPDRLKRRKTVKHVKSVFPLYGDPVVNIHGKGLKAFIRIKLKDLQPFSGGKKGLMVCKPHIDQISPVTNGLFYKRLHKIPEFLQICHLPHYVVSHTDIIQQIIQTWYTA